MHGRAAAPVTAKRHLNIASSTQGALRPVVGMDRVEAAFPKETAGTSFRVHGRENPGYQGGVMHQTFLFFSLTRHERKGRNLMSKGKDRLL